MIKNNTKDSQGMVLHVYNPSTQEAETKGSQWVQDQPGLPREFQAKKRYISWAPDSKSKHNLKKILLQFEYSKLISCKFSLESRQLVKLQIKLKHFKSYDMKIKW